MRRMGAKRCSGRMLSAALCAAVAALATAVPAQADFDDPVFVYRPVPDVLQNPQLKPPPAAYLEGPCGLAVDRLGNLYVSDYHHDAVDVYKRSDDPTFAYLTQIPSVDPLDGPCGLAVDSAGRVAVNDYHRSVVRYTPEVFPPVAAVKEPPIPATAYGSLETIDPVHPIAADAPTGVALHPVTENVYVDNRTYVAVYQPSGAPVEVSGEPLRIGEGSLEDGYGVAVDPGGRVYVPDAGNETVKVFDPALDADDPVLVIDGSGVPGGGFISLRDSAIAVDQVSGKVYVADDLQPAHWEEPEAAVYVFNASGSYLGRLKHNVVDARPPGLAVDNSPEATQGRVYVTSGNTELAAVYAYPPGAETTKVVTAEKQLGEAPKGTPLPAGGASAGAAGSASAAGPPGPARAGSGATASEATQKGSLRLALGGELTPRRLPRKGSAPVAVAIDWKLATTDGSAVPPLKSVRIEINRHGLLDYSGLPVCDADRIQPASSSRALAACRDALVGQGRFEADISLAGQESYPAAGRLLVFNGVSHGKPVLLGQIYSPRPFATSFVIVFKVQGLRRGTYGTALTAKLPAALAGWGNLTGVRMKLSRQYRAGGKRRSYLSAGCPAPKGFPGASFPLTRASFDFGGGLRMSDTLVRSCRAR
jgi:DNA-binding beta-propeller fold protein YncE